MSTSAQTFELKLIVPAVKKEAFCEHLVAMGISGFVEGSLDCDIPFEYGDKHLGHDYYADHKKGSEPIVFYGTSREELLETLESIKASLSGIAMDENEMVVEWGELADKDWKESWKESFRPLPIGDDLVILPPWEDKRAFPGRTIIEINPGMAFGTGQHETTKLCLELYMSETKRRFDRVFDVGTGSGILAIAARLYGCPYVLGCDIDPDSVRIAEDNAQVNAVPDCRFTNEKLSLIDDRDFDLIFANIQAKPLSILLPAIFERSSPNYTLIISGVLGEEKESFTERLSENGAAVTLSKHMGDWVGLLVRPASSLS